MSQIGSGVVLGVVPKVKPESQKAEAAQEGVRSSGKAAVQGWFFLFASSYTFSVRTSMHKEETFP